MKKAFPIRRVKTGRRNPESGVTMILVALAMVAIIAMAALSIDVITLYLARQEAQRSADSAALAAARVISLSGMTGDPGNISSSWSAVCGGASSPASLAAISVATQNSVGGAVPLTPTVNYSAGGQPGVADCSTLPAAFGVNPMVTVQVRRTSLPTFFARIWGTTSNTVSATATAEAFNPSASDLNGNGPTGSVTPVQPSCVKPLMIPNQNPNLPITTCNNAGTPCDAFVSIADGTIVDKGVQPTTSTGVIGSSFNLFADCGVGSPCVPQDASAQANGSKTTYTGGGAPPNPNLEYLPGEAPASALAAPSCASSGGGGSPEFSPAVAGCDQKTTYHCGVAGSPNVIDLVENPGGPAPAGDTASAVACLLTNDPTTNPLSGQDLLDASVYPYKIRAGASNPTGLGGNFVTTSNSIMTLPIYDSNPPLVFAGGRANVTIVGFLQVFVNQIRPDGSMNVTVLNVSGCGNGSAPTNNPVMGSSPVPVRLITPP